LASILDSIREPLSANGLAVSQIVMRSTTYGTEPGGRYLKTLLLHKSGQWLAGEYPLPDNVTPQQMGSALTYARRYALAAIICNAPDDDDDANAASAAKPRAPRPAPDVMDGKPRPTPSSAQSAEPIKEDTSTFAQNVQPSGSQVAGEVYNPTMAELADDARVAAKRGSVSFQVFWRKLTLGQRGLAQGMSEELRNLMNDADRALPHDPETGETQ
jgi:hypothetical protein